MTIPEEETNAYGSHTRYLMVLLCLTLSTTNSLVLPQVSMSNGALGTLICYIAGYVLLGIPAVYMELIISQFTGRNCIEIWKIRPCLSHIGYFLFFWQIMTISYNHIKISILLHYLFITFESPPPYSVCGPWANHECEILKVNYTLNQNCVRVREPMGICQNLHTTYAEYQYFSRVLLSGKKYEFYVAWPLCVSSAVVTTMLFMICFQKIKSIKWFLHLFILFPIIGYIILLTGSMCQKGLILHYADAIDADFSTFSSRFRLSNIIVQVINSLGAGTGVLTTLASAAPFRSPCYASAVVAVLVAAAFSVLAICVTGMMPCPYAFESGMSPRQILTAPVSFSFIKIPKMFSEYTNKSFWILVIYSCQVFLGMSTHIAFFFSLMQILAAMNENCRKYPALVALFGSITLFIITIPFLGTIGKNVIGTSFMKYLFLECAFFTLMENVVFMLAYGLERFYEDIHFMQGIQPRSYMKVGWIFLSIMLTFSFLNEYIMIVRSSRHVSDIVAITIISLMIFIIFFIFIIKIIVGAVKQKFLQQFALDPLWGPKNEILRRSRAMFTAHAMTKEYMYRQYHLQAGILARQRRSNTRATSVSHPTPRFITSNINIL